MLLEFDSSHIYLWKLFEKLYENKIIVFQTILLLRFSYVNIFTKIFWKNYQNKSILFKWFLSNFQSILVVAFSLYIYIKIFKNFLQTKIFHFKLFCYSDFPCYIYLQKVFEKFMKAKTWYFKLCWYWVFLFIYFSKNFWKKYENKNIVSKWFLSNFQSIFVVGFFLQIYIYENLLKNLWK